MEHKPMLLVCIPVMDEMDFLPDTIHCLEKQEYRDFRVYFCVNQPENFWLLQEKQHVCKNNMLCLRYLNEIKSFPLHVVDRASPGKGWTGKKHGVGWARKTIMDIASNEGQASDIIISLDADTVFGASYFRSLKELFHHNWPFSAVSIPYYHCLTGDEAIDRAILRYEIYLRHYFLNLAHTGSPFAFTAIGSAIALKVSEYRRVNGITPHLSGEDFYFLEKLAKSKAVMNMNSEKVYPAARLSDRVFFGTGPALIKGTGGNWESYPLYPLQGFLDIAETYKLFPLMFEKNVKTPLDDFLQSNFSDDFWSSARKNSGTAEAFIKACHQKLDGLKILQYLRYFRSRETSSKTDEENLLDYMNYYYPEDRKILYPKGALFSFRADEIPAIERIRNLLCEKEDLVRDKQYNEWMK